MLKDRYEVTAMPHRLFGVWDNGQSAYAVRLIATEAGARKICADLNAKEAARRADRALVRLLKGMAK